MRGGGKGVEGVEGGKGVVVFRRGGREGSGV